MVGAGNSGAQIALELAQSGRPTWLSGRDTGSIPRRVLGRDVYDWLWWTVLRPSVDSWVGRRLMGRGLFTGDPLVGFSRRALMIPALRTVGRTVGVSNGYPQLDDGRVLEEVRTVVWCTGFRPDFRWIQLPAFGPDTYGLFDLERGVPTDAYSLEEAVKDGFLVPPKAVSVPMKFPREGITYDELPEEEQEQWDAVEWQEDGGVPDRVEAPAINKWLFNEDTVDKVLAHVMTRGQAVAGGDRIEPAFKRLSEQVKGLAGLLEEKASIPMVAQELPLIFEIQSDEWWQDVTPVMLESARRRLRLLIKLIDKQKRKPIYTDFEDEMGDESAVQLPGFDAPHSAERFKAKARVFLRAHEDHTAIQKLRMNRPLTRGDLSELERMLTDSGVGGAGEVQKAKAESQGLGLFVRLLVGLDREAAKNAFAKFLGDKTLKANQIEFINLIVDHLTEHGVMSASLLYESPFTDVTPQGPDGLFTSPQLHELLAILDDVRATAIAA